MRLLKNYIALNIIGILMWISGLFLQGINIYPIPLVLIYGAPIVLMFGIIGWIYSYKLKNKSYPNIFKSFYKSWERCSGYGFFAFYITPMHFLISHFGHWIITCFLFMMVTTFSMIPVFNNSVVFEITQTYINNNEEFLSYVGGVKYYAPLISGSISSSGDGEINFTVVGKDKTVTVKAKVNNKKVVNFEYK